MHMPSLERALTELRAEQHRIQGELQHVDEAIHALVRISSSGGRGRKARATGSGRRGRRRLSAAARKRIADAQRARWAKFKLQKAKKAA
jgi:hypothetical protein